MTFPEKAVVVCCTAMSTGTVKASHIRNVVRYDDVNVKPLLRFLKSDHDHVRKAASTIIGQRGDAAELIDVALNDKSKDVVLEALRWLHNAPDRVEDVVSLLHSEDPVVKEAAVQMFRRANRSDCLYLLVFEEDDHLVNRVRRTLKAEEDGKKRS